MNIEWSFDDHQSIIKFKQEFRNRHKNHVRITISITSPQQIGQRWNQYSVKFYLFAQIYFWIIHIICSFPWFDCLSKLNANLLTIWPNLIKHQQQQFIVVGKIWILRQNWLWQRWNVGGGELVTPLDEHQLWSSISGHHLHQNFWKSTKVKDGNYLSSQKSNNLEINVTMICKPKWHCPQVNMEIR